RRSQRGWRVPSASGPHAQASSAAEVGFRPPGYPRSRTPLPLFLMKTHLADFIRDTPDGKEAEAILRNCVHCGFCTATCPTYQLLGDDLDGPRGRIYLIKQVLEGQPVTQKTQLHLDRCLTCRACETTCPSGVHYSRLADIGRHVVESKVARGPASSAARTVLRKVVSRPALFGPLLRMGQLVRPLLP